MTMHNPLTDANLEDLNKALSDSADADELIEAAGRAGLEVTEFKERNREARERLTRIKTTFFPGK